jgi:hypothetical protein
MIGIGQLMLDNSLNIAKNFNYYNIFLYLDGFNHLKIYLKNCFMDIPRYDGHHSADIFMENCNNFI